CYQVCVVHDVMKDGHYARDHDQTAHPHHHATGRYERDQGYQPGGSPAAEVPTRDSRLKAGDHSGRSVGKRMTSRIDTSPARTITRRSMPSPNPPVGGMPNSSARM